MEFFSTPDLIEIGGYPFPVQGYKPTREEAIEYYRGVAAREQLDVRLYERVLDVRGERGRLHRHDRPRRAPRPRTSSSRPASSTSRTCSACRARTCRRSRTTTASRTPTSGRRSLVDRRAELRRQGRARLLPARRRGHAGRARRRRCPTRSSTGSSPTSRTASRKAASSAFFNTTVEEIRERQSCCARPEGQRRSRTTGCWR